MSNFAVVDHGEKKWVWRLSQQVPLQNEQVICIPQNTREVVLINVHQNQPYWGTQLERDSAHRVACGREPHGDREVACGREPRGDRDWPVDAPRDGGWAGRSARQRSGRSAARSAG